MFDEVALTDVEFDLGPGDTLLLYTDGATEARPPVGTPERRQFGEDGLAEALAACDGLDATATVTRLANVLATHSHSWAADDTALLAVRVPPASSA